MSDETKKVMDTPASGRVQLALNVEDLEASMRFYADLFGVEPTKAKPGYVNLAIAEPPLKLIRFEGGKGGKGGTINHLGVEVAESRQVADAIDRLQNAEMAIEVEEKVICCYASQDKVWATAPDGEGWEYYTVLADAEQRDGFAPSDTASECCPAAA